MKWFRKISMKAGMEVDFSNDCTGHQNDIFTILISEQQPISDPNLSATQPVFFNHQHGSTVDYVVINSKNIISGEKELRKSSVYDLYKFEELSDFNNCTSLNIVMK